MSFVPGYQLIEQLYDSERSLIVRASRDSDGLPVIIKILKSEFPSLEELARFRREFEITSGISSKGVIRAHEIHRHGKGLVMVLEDFDGMSVADLLRDRPLSLDEFLDVAVQVTEALAGIHQGNIIHKDISPANIVINPGTGEAKIIDFGIATRVTSEQPVLQSPEVLEGTLAYMSPEQTGRMNRSLDYRTDFYSLGATFYLMLTRSLAFEADDKMEMVHCHIAREPVPASRRNSDVPLPLSKIISKLMTKKAEGRYQSAAGIIADLEAVRLGVGLDRFEPGRHDHSERFHVPERLYGREEEVERLLEGFDRARHGRAELMLVAGYSGIGKSALVSEVHKPITRARGYFITGKFDQFQRNDPYAGLVKALRDLVRQLLTENETRLASWRKDLGDALEPNGQVILEVLPELELVIGPQPAVPELEPAEAANRFRRVVGQLLRALCDRDRTVVLFLDDLQWADSASLDLMRVVLGDESIKRLFLIGAYRDNEVDAMHPLSIALRDIEKAGARVETLTLAPLGFSDVAKLVAETVHAAGPELSALARLVLQKTQGNPLFVRQFLADLHREGLIRQTPATSTERARWVWDLAAIQSAGITDNLVELLLGRLRKLSPRTQEALLLAACIGSRFDIDTLALIQKTTSQDAFESLRPAIEEELVVPRSELTTTDGEELDAPLLVRELAFQHDRVQQAAYSLIDEAREKEVHLTIGRSLRATLSEDALNERIFEVVDHFNYGRALIEDPAERLVLAQLNVAAAEKASDATAYSAALPLVEIAQDLLGEDGWRDNYEITFKASRQRAQLEYLNGNFKRCEEIVATTLERARTDLERAEVYFTRIAQHTLLAEFAQAEDAGCNALELLGVPFPRDNLAAAGQEALGKVSALLEGKNPATLINEPDVKSPEVALAQRSLRHLTIAAFLANQEMWPLVVGTSVRLSLEHGNAPESALSYSNFGLILGAFMGRYKDGWAFGELALKLCDKFEGRAPVATVCLVTGVELIPWVKHVREAMPVIDRGYQDGLNTGDILWAGYLVMYKCVLGGFAGKRLDDLLADIPAQLDFNVRTNNLGAVLGIQAHEMAYNALAGRTRSSAVFTGEGIDEATFLRTCEENQMSIALVFFKILKAQALYLLGRPREALDATNEVEGMLDFILNHPNLADHLLYQSLSLSALHQGTDGESDKAAVEKITANLTKLKVWAENCPDNFLAKCLMVEAELARISGAESDAAEYYDRAIEAASEAHFLHDEALANELAARFVLAQRPRARVGAMYLRDAWYAYQLWGAQRKLEELALEFPQLLTADRDLAARHATNTTQPSGRTVRTASTNVSGKGLDLDTLIKAGQTISGEVVLGRLLERLLGIVIENVGAQRGVLLLSRDGTLFIEAESSVVSDEVAVLMSLPIDSADGAALVPAGIVNFAARTREEVVVDDAQKDERFLADPYVQERETRSVLCQPIMNQGNLIGLVYLENDLTNAAFTPDRARLVSLLSGQIAISIQNAELVENLEEKVRERTEQLEMHARFIEQTFGRYLSSEIADRLLKSPDGLDFSGRKTTVTVMMSDLRGFSTFSDVLPPETIVKLLNNYLSEMTMIVQKYNGTIDAFIGDAILATFGAPFQRPDDAERAVACALEMQLAMPRVNAWNAQNGLPELEMGIGLNTGEVVVGNIGSRKRAKYGVVGSNVNLAVRIEGYTVGGQVLISRATRDAVQTPLTVADARTVEPKGIAHPVTLFDVSGLGGKYDLELPKAASPLTAVEPPMPLTFRLVVGKKVVGEAQEGALLELSTVEAVIRSPAAPTPFTDLQLLLAPPDGSNIAPGVYGKVLDRRSPSGTFALRFTSVPPEARSVIAELSTQRLTSGI
ncbi:MAG: AAA family ATPase [Pseudomonadota bacterium]